jgi:hypothetical protein
MNDQVHKSLHRAAHVVLHSEPGKEAIKAVGATVIGMAAPLLATPAAPLVAGAAVIGGAYLGAKELLKRLDS